MTTSKKGSALTEYALPLALMVLVSYPFWQAISQGFGNQLETVFAENSSNASLATNQGGSSGTIAALSGQTNNNVSPSASLNNPASVSPAGPWSDTKYPASSAIIESAGVNGYTEALAAYLYRMSQELLAAGEIDAMQSSAIIDLANQGYRMAAIQKVIEDKAQLYLDDKKGFQDALVTFDAQTHTVQHWGYQLNTAFNETGAPTPVETMRFKTLLDNVIQGNQKIQDPTTLTILKSLGDEIWMVSNRFQDTVTGMDQTVEPADLASKTYSLITSAGSKNICATGGGKASKVDCSNL